MFIMFIIYIDSYKGGGATDGGAGAGGSSRSFGYNTMYTSDYRSGNGYVSITFFKSFSVSYGCSGKMEDVTVPKGVNYMYADVIGASSGTGGTGIAGKGARVQSYFPVRPSTVLHLFVGCKGSSYSETSCTSLNPGGFNGGGSVYCYSTGGGGASDIRYPGTDVSSRIVVAGGGGGFAGGCGVQKGGDAGKYGTPGTASTLNTCPGYGEPGGGGGNWTYGGAASSYGSPAPIAGSLGYGGNGGSGSGGGGGGGYYGGKWIPKFIVDVFISYAAQEVEERMEDQVAEDLAAHSVLMCSIPVDIK